MNLKEEILREHSKAQTLRIAKYVGDDKKRFSELVRLVMKNEKPVSQRAAWIMSYSVGKYPDLFKPYLASCVKNLDKPDVHEGVKRNVLRVLQDIEIPARLMGKLTDSCFRLLMNPKEAIAVRVFSMAVLFNIVRRESGLKGELKLVIEEALVHGGPAIQSRGKKILKQLEKLKDQ